MLEHLVGERRVSLAREMRVLHGEAVVAVQVDSGRLRVECQALLQGVLEHGFTFGNALSRVLLDLIGRLPLHAKQTLHWICARLLPELVLNLLAGRAHLCLILPVASALALAIDLAVRVVVAVSAELR